MTLDERALLLQVAVLMINRNKVSVDEQSRLSNLILRISERQQNEAEASRDYIEEYLTDPPLRQPTE